MGDITFSDRLVENTADGAAIRVTSAGSGTATEVEIIAPLDGDGALEVSGPLTDAQLRATPVPVDITFPGSIAVTGPLTDAELRASAVPVSGAVAVSNFPATQPVSGPLTDTQLRAVPVPVSGTVTATGPLTDTQLRATPVPVSGTVAATQSGTWTVQPGNTANTTAWKVDGSAVTQPVSGPLTDTQLRAVPVPVSGTVTATGPLTDTQLRAVPVPVSGTVTATGPLTDTQLRATPVPVSGPLTDTQLRATPVPVSGTVTASGPLTDTQLRASAVPVSGPLTDTQLRASAVPVSGTVTANIGTSGSLALNATLTGGTQTTRITDGTNTAVVLGSGAAPASGDSALNVTISPNSSSFLISSPIYGSVSLGTSSGKTNVLKTGSATTTATTADQVILTYTTTAGKTFYLEYFDFIARLTTFATTATNFGTVSLESAAGTKLYTSGFFAAGAADARWITFSEPIPIAASTVIRIVCTPSANTSFLWFANFGGYEK